MKRVGIVGTGFIAEKHAMGMQGFDNIRLCGVADIIPEKRNAFAQRYGVRSYDSYKEMLEDDTVDFTIICVPSFLHLDLALQSINAKKPFLLEKPMALNESDAKRIYLEAETANVPMMVAQSLRFKEEYMAACQWTRDGLLGNVKMVYASRLGQRPTWAKWHRDTKKFGGVLYDLMLHDIDYVYSLFGKVTSVYAAGRCLPDGGYDDVFVTLNFECGVKAIIDGSSQMTPGYPFTMNLRIDGDGGTIEYRFIGGENTEVCKESTLRLYRNGEAPFEYRAKGFSNHGKEDSYFADCLENGRYPMSCPPEQSLEVMHVLNRIERSLKTGNIEIV